MKKKKLLAFFVCAVMVVSTFSGCEGRTSQSHSIEDLSQNGEINYETSDLGMQIKEVEKAEQKKDKKNPGMLTGGRYYVLHNDKYYPLVNYVNTYESEFPEDLDTERMNFFTLENEHNIPTLFLGNGDKLIFYAEETILDYITWERYMDLGYTFGIYNIKQLTNERAYIEAEDNYLPILEASELYDLYNFKVESILLDKIGGVQITPDMIESGILTGATKSKQYDLELYTGTQYRHYLTTANIHAFRAMEMFASVNYETKQSYMYEIEIPKYFVDGYYMVNNVGMLRIVTGTSYNDETNFNERLLYPYEEVSWDGSIEYGPMSIYSEFEPLNEFSTNVEGKLGYVEPEPVYEPILPEKEKEESEEKPTVLSEAKVTSLNLFFPKDVSCIITVTSPSKENTGDCYVKIGTQIFTLYYDRMLGIYSNTIPGSDVEGTLTISGLRENYSINLVGCKELKEGSTEESKDENPQKEEPSNLFGDSNEEKESEE